MSKEKKEVQYVVHSAKLRKVKDFHVLDVAFDEITTIQKDQKEAFTAKVTKEGTRPVHQDLKDKLKLLVPHFLILSEMKEHKTFKKAYFEKLEALTDESIESFGVTGVHIKEKESANHAIILGRKILKNGRVISMVIPMISLEQKEDGDGYEHTEELATTIDEFLDEVELYMNGKFAPTPQQSLQDELDKTMKVAV